VRPVQLILGIVLGIVTSATPAESQQGPKPDSATVESYRVVLFALRDTVSLVSARSAEFRRDLRTVGDGTVISRSQRLVAACEAARGALGDTRPKLAGLPTNVDSRPLRDSVLVATRNLSRSLDVECVRGLGPEGPGVRADTLRAWGPSRTAALGQVITAYHGAVARLARTLGIDLSHR